MKKIALLILCFLLIVPCVSVAKDAPKKETEKKEEKSLVSEADCRAIVSFQPKADGSAEYQPGVDVHGKPVMEAELNPSPIQMPDKYSFDITVDTAKYMGINVPAGVLGEAKFGTITFEKGQLKFDGKPLEGEEEAALKELCGAKKPM